MPRMPPKSPFSSKIDYELILEKHKKEFMECWNSITPSPETGLLGYEEVATVGVGVFGIVKLVRDQTCLDRVYAVKIMNKAKIVRFSQVAHVFNEKNVLRCIRFPFTVSLVFSSKDNDYLYLGMQNVLGGELFTLLCRSHKFSEKVARFYCAQVVLALEYLHYMGVLYRDLKPENVLIDHRGYIKLADFGFAKLVNTRTLTLCGTPEYLAPEIILSKPYGKSVDWWAFGVFVYELVYGRSPFGLSHRNVMAMYTKICDGHYKMPEHFSDALKNLVDNLLQVDLSKRLGNLLKGDQDIKDHMWFRKVNWNAMLKQEVPTPYTPPIQHDTDLSNFPDAREVPLTKTFKNNHRDIFAAF